MILTQDIPLRFIAKVPEVKQSTQPFIINI